MEREIPHSADHSPVEKRPIAQGLEELRTVLGDVARLALTSGSAVVNLTREDFQSQTYQQAGYGAMPERYGPSDRYLYTLVYADGTQLILFGGNLRLHVILRVLPRLTLWRTTGSARISF